MVKEFLNSSHSKDGSSKSETVPSKLCIKYFCNVSLEILPFFRSVGGAGINSPRAREGDGGGVAVTNRDGST